MLKHICSATTFKESVRHRRYTEASIAAIAHLIALTIAVRSILNNSDMLFVTQSCPSSVRMRCEHLSRLLHMQLKPAVSVYVTSCVCAHNSVYKSPVRHSCNAVLDGRNALNTIC
jgi:hypothetical protein